MHRHGKICAFHFHETVLRQIEYTNRHIRCEILISTIADDKLIALNVKIAHKPLNQRTN